MKNPVELEKKIFENNYNSLQEEYAAEKYVEFEKEINDGLSTCQNFINKIKKEFKNKGAPKDDINESEKLDFLQYLYGNLMQGFVDYSNQSLEKNIRSFVEKKNACDGYRFFRDIYELPELEGNIFSYEICSTDLDDDSFTDDSEELKILAE